MRPFPALAAAFGLVALAAAVRLVTGAPAAAAPHLAAPAWAVFSFAVSAFRGPLR